MCASTCLKLSVLLICGWLVLCDAPLWAETQNSTGEAALHLLEEAGRRNADIQSLSANFEQKKNMAMLALPFVSQGFFCLSHVVSDKIQPRKADKLLWAYTSPLSSGFVYENGRGNLWDGSPSNQRPANDREGAVITAIIQHILDWIHIDATALRAVYKLERPQTEEPVLVLYPRRRSFFSKLEVVFASDLKTVRQLTFMEQNGDSVHISFSHILINEALPAQCEGLKTAPPNSSGF